MSIDKRLLRVMSPSELEHVVSLAVRTTGFKRHAAIAALDELVGRANGTRKWVRLPDDEKVSA